MTVKILYFAWLREKAGVSEQDLDIPEDVTSFAQLMFWLGEQNEGLQSAFADPQKIRVAADHEYVTFDTPIGQTREIAFFPPVTGG